MPLPPPPPPPPPSNETNAKREKKDWEAKKKQREAEKAKKRKTNGDDSDEDADDSSQRNHRKIKIAPDEGFYTVPADGISNSNDTQTWLEGAVFGDILEEDMPVQVWLGSGSPAISDAELRLPENARHWKDGIVAAVRQRPSAEARAGRLVVDVAYLKTTTSTTKQQQQESSNGGDGDGGQQEEETEEEELKKSVPLQHIRILLGNSAVDDRIPDTLEEARLLAMGGEEIIVKKMKKEDPSSGNAAEAVDEATGLSGWSTVKIKRTTIRSELKEEREAARQKRKMAAAKAEQQAKEAEARRMEEAKVSNANDSALGAYDVWSRTSDGYKGVNIHDAANVEVSELGKKLAEGKGKVGFKKSAFKAKKKVQNRRTTSADDD